MKDRRNWFIGIVLFLITMALYWPAVTFPFINYDDQEYVYENSAVTNGLSLHGIKWAFSSVVCANWHPLTVVSHMADCSVYGLFAGGHHLTNILLHSTNVVLLWLLLRHMTKSFWPCAFAAALFAWHPLNVESVVWISERKNVLSTLFFILTIWAYLRYAKNPRLHRYALALILFVLGLLAKPMLVTVPFLLVLLDYWPLQRINSTKDLRENRFLILEKIPFLFFAVADSVITYITQSREGSIKSTEFMSLKLRLLNIPVAYLTYLGKIFWPAKLCVVYPFPKAIPVATAMFCAVLLIVVTTLAWRWRNKSRWMLIGWLWFLGMLFPVIGLVQIGIQAMANRYVYVPWIGIFLIIVCGLSSFSSTKIQMRALISMVTIVFLGFMLVQTRKQIMYWQNSVALFTYEVEVNPDSAVANDLLGVAYHNAGEISKSVNYYAAAVHIQPDDAMMQYRLGHELIDAGRFAESENHLISALVKMPKNPALYNTLGVAFIQDGKTNKAEEEFLRAINLEPRYPNPYFNLGKALLLEGQTKPAITNLLAAVNLDPDWPEALESLARAYANSGDFSNAVLTASRALVAAKTSHEQQLANQITTELENYKKMVKQ